MPFTIDKVLAAVAVMVLPGCIGTSPSAESLERADRHTGGNVIVLTDSHLARETGTVLDAMTRRISSMRVDDRFDCPAVALRGGPNPMPGMTDPRIYVDGTRVSDTCILESLRAGDVERVEVYPLGFTHRPGYATSAHGLILIFMRGA